MDIETGKRFTTIQEIKTADCFEWEKHICIKTKETDPDGDIQVVDLKTGEVHRLPPDTVVTPIVAIIDFDGEVI